MKRTRFNKVMGYIKRSRVIWDEDKVNYPRQIVEVLLPLYRMRKYALSKSHKNSLVFEKHLYPRKEMELCAYELGQSIYKIISEYGEPFVDYLLEHNERLFYMHHNKGGLSAHEEETLDKMFN